MRHRLGIIGARGHVGGELLRFVMRHPALELALVTSTEARGKRVRDVVRDVPSDLVFEGHDPAMAAARDLDAVVLGLPNGEAPAWVSTFVKTRPSAVIVDLSGDHRFNDAWVYGQPERRRASIRGATRIANPGCYATAAQLAIEPLVAMAGGGPFTVFGVSGYSGAGATPSPRNDPERLKDAILPYALVDHLHERELRHVLAADVDFLPHVAPFFRGLSVTVTVHLAAPMTKGELVARFQERYRDEPLVRLVDDPPTARDAALQDAVLIGGCDVSKDGLRAVVVSALDNLLAGAATQALRNLNLALGHAERLGIDA